MAARLDTLGDATTYGIYPAGWALAMNTPYPWTKQVAHLGGTRDGMIVRWGNGIAARGEIRHQWHHVIDVLPTILEADRAAGARGRSAASTQQPIEGTSLHYSFDDADAPDRHTTQYFEMIGNRGVYHEGWTAVTRHGIPWEMVETPKRPFDEDVWELYDHADDWSQARDLADAAPRAAAGAPGGLPARGREVQRPPARRPGHRAREPGGRRPARPAPRPLDAVVRSAGRSAHRGGRAQRQEPLARHHRRPRGGHRHQRRGRRAGRPVRRLVALRRRRRAALRLQLRGPRPDRRPRREADGAGPPRPGRPVRLRRRSARQRSRRDPRGRRRRRSARGGSR